LASDTNARSEIDVFEGKVLRIYEPNRKRKREWGKEGQKMGEGKGRVGENCIMRLFIIYIQILW
jgi:hypothetical protein